MADRPLFKMVGDQALTQAQLGNPRLFIQLLAGRLGPLGPDLETFLVEPATLAFFVELLKTTHGRRAQAELLLQEKMSIRDRVRDLEAGYRDKPPMKREAAVRMVMDERKCSRRTVFAAMQLHGIFHNSKGDQIPLRSKDLSSMVALRSRISSYEAALSRRMKSRAS